MPKTGAKRRLTAILAADVVGYSRLMGKDETGTLERLKSVRRELVQPAITDCNGRIVKLMGDGLLAEFPSVVEAVQCAVAIQESVGSRDPDMEDNQRIRLRIGVNLGDILIEGSDIYGDGVNVAARLEGLADAGGICISDTVRLAMGNKLPLEYEFMGEQSMKNIKEPINVYQVQLKTTAGVVAHSPNRIELEVPDKPSIAVLPFTNMSGDPEQEYFSDGISEDIITELSHFKELSVVSRNSSFAFKGQSVAIKEVSEKLRVQYVVEGSIRKAGNKVRVTVQLINATDDSHIWADRYDRNLEDIFEVQDDVVQHIAGTLVGRLEYERQERTKRQSGNQLRAYDLYLRGRQLFFNLSIEDNSKALKYLQAAIAIEPDYAAALALSSEVLLRMWLNGWSENADDDLAASFKAARRADQIDDQDSRVHTALGLAYIFQRNLGKAKHHFDTALKLNPNDTRALVYYSRQAVFDGNIKKALELSRRALNLNPYGKYNYNLAIACFAARQYQESIERLESISNPPATLLYLLAASYAMAGDDENAANTYALFRKAVKSCPGFSNLKKPDDWRAFISARWPFRKSEDSKHLLDAFGKAGVPL